MISIHMCARCKFLLAALEYVFQQLEYTALTAADHQAAVTAAQSQHQVDDSTFIPLYCIAALNSEQLPKVAELLQSEA
jgi:hypothetical protein